MEATISSLFASLFAQADTGQWNWLGVSLSAIIPALIGVQFTLLGSFKLYGLCRGVVGGADKPFATRLCGT